MKEILILPHDLEQARHLINYGLDMALFLNQPANVVFHIDPTNQGYYPPHADPGTFPGELTYNEAIEKEKSIIAEKLQSIIDNHLALLNPAPAVKLNVHVKPGSGVTAKEFEGYDPLFVLLSKNDEGDFPGVYYEMKSFLKIQAAPVLIVPENVPFDFGKGIVYASDNHEDDVDVLADLTGRMQKKHLKLVLLHVFHSDSKEVPWDDNRFADIQWIDKERVVLHGDDVAMKIHAYIEKQPVGLLVLMKQNHKFWESLFNPSQTKKIISETDVPILVYYEGKDS